MQTLYFKGVQGGIRIRWKVIFSILSDDLASLAWANDTGCWRRLGDRATTTLTANDGTVMPVYCLLLIENCNPLLGRRETFHTASEVRGRCVYAAIGCDLCRVLQLQVRPNEKTQTYAKHGTANNGGLFPQDQLIHGMLWLRHD